MGEPFHAPSDNRASQWLPAGFPRWSELAHAAILSVAATAIARLFIPLVERFGGDDRHYVAMAIDPTDPVPTPFAFRVLTPWLVHVSGADPLPSFHVISLGFLAAGGFFTYLIARGIGAGHGAGLLAVFGLLSLRAWLFFVYNPYLSDPSAMALTAAAFSALVWGPTSVIPAIAAVWALSRELWAGFALPAYMWLRHGLFDMRAAARVALMLLPAFIIYEMVLQLAPHSSSERIGNISWLVIQNVFEERLTADLGWYLVYTFAGSLGVWWVLSLGATGAAGALWWWMVPVFGQFLLGTDWARYMLIAFVVVVPVGAIAAWRHPRRTVLLGIVALQLVATAADVMVDDRLKLNQIQPSTIITAILMVAAAVVLWTPAAWWPAWTRGQAAAS